jgi:nicotinamide-nucleotide amidase
MNAEIITIGDELLIGQTIDTNSAWIGRELTKLGFTVYQKTAVRDDKKHIIQSFDEALQRSQLVLVTGGLGPTKDDITKTVLCEYFDTKLKFNDNAYSLIERFVFERGGQMNESNKGQALQPESCTFIPNNNGTASGMWFEKDGRVLVSMPGVPFEMEQMMTETILPKIASFFKTPVIVVRNVLTTGISESKLAETISNWEDALPQNTSLAYLPSPGMVKLRLMVTGSDEQALNEQADFHIKELTNVIPNNIFAFEDESFAAIIGKKLKELNKTLSVAESCTGGFIAHSITLNSGCSAYFKGSVTAYANEVKETILGVPHQMLVDNGAVSELVVRAMAEGVKRALQSDYAIATTGIAGPDGGTVEKPVGTVWIAVSGPNGTVAQKYKYGNDRVRFISRACNDAFDLLKRVLK